MNLQLFIINVIYDNINNFLKTINTYIIAERFAFTIKYSKKSKKVDLI